MSKSLLMFKRQTSPSGVICQPASLAKHGNDAAYMREVRFIEIRFFCAVAQTGSSWWPPSNFCASVCINSTGTLLLQIVSVWMCHAAICSFWGAFCSPKGRSQLLGMSLCPSVDVADCWLPVDGCDPQLFTSAVFPNTNQAQRRSQKACTAYINC